MGGPSVAEECISQGSPYPGYSELNCLGTCSTCGEFEGQDALGRTITFCGCSASDVPTCCDTIMTPAGPKPKGLCAPCGLTGKCEVRVVPDGLETKQAGCYPIQNPMGL
jgi:hypothetical protein